MLKHLLLGFENTSQRPRRGSENVQNETQRSQNRERMDNEWNTSSLFNTDARVAADDFNQFDVTVLRGIGRSRFQRNGITLLRLIFFKSATSAHFGMPHGR